MKPTTTYYAYRQLVDQDGKPVYIIPLADPMVYEHPFDHLFDTPEEAEEHLIECLEEGLYGDDLVQADLTLVEITMEPVLKDDEELDPSDEDELEFNEVD